ncbi:MAG: CoA pyrophosphatase [Rhodobacteraceae bacterium]|nr:CoA pyrophosphatase [Paracoccaceae bacterium]
MDIRSDPFDKLRRAVATRNGAGSSDFDLNPSVLAKLPATRKLRPASVLIPVIERDGLHVILTRRSGNLAHHPGQVAFPGGKVDPSDNSHEDAALREAEEEIGLPRQNVEILGRIDTHETITGFLVTPFVARVHRDFKPSPEPGEVAEVFEVPLTFLTNPQNLQVLSRSWQGQKRSYLAIPYGPHFIWGATARMIKGLADRMST